MERIIRMKILQAVFRKAIRDTIKTQDGSFHGVEADISLTIEGEYEEEEVIDKLNQLIEKVKSNDPAWIQNKLPWEETKKETEVKNGRQWQKVGKSRNG